MASNSDFPTITEPSEPRRDERVPAAPTMIGRFRVMGEVGRGGFGVVYRAFDEQLQRVVAVKVPFRMPAGLRPLDDGFFGEARIAAQLDHPNIVPVYDVGSCDGIPMFIVSRLIDGTSLAVALAKRTFTPMEVAQLAAALADALSCAHAHGLVHRDVKPSNILIDRDDVPYLTDFGLALREEQYGIEGGRILGTIFYMSPEQARGEGHLVDGRADIFSLGVVLYELLTGARPFVGRQTSEILDAVAAHDPRPPRQRNASIPREVERICLQAMAKRPSERYSTARDMADDLRAFLTATRAPAPAEPPSTITVSAQSRGNAAERDAHSTWDLARPAVVPKGLRAFDATDSDFFLTLLPKPLDRHGLPQSLSFWKTRLEDESAASALRVGVVYGPSGCGKSSLVRAGLLPRLAPSIHSIVITATATGTERALLDALEPRLEGSPEGIVDAFQRLRRAGKPERVVVVLDQFEQWLHANPVRSDSPLINALRQCDGRHVACLLVVRDDFWMSIHRVFRELDVRLAEQETCAAVDLFDTRHAERVLGEFGFAYGALPGRPESRSAEQQEFLDHVIAELTDDDHVICVRLALFAHMVRDRPWTTATLKAVGGARGVGVRFLEDAFGARSSPLSYRVYRGAAAEVLHTLLPAPGTDIRARTRTSGELARAAGMDEQGSGFARVLQILEEETRLITPVDDARGAAPEGRPAGCYQLTHDYLVPSIREWISRRQRSTWRGRAALRLEERAALWSERRERKQLPSLLEVGQILLGTTVSRWSPMQAEMMRQALRLHGQRLAVAVLVGVLGAVAGRTWGRSHQEALRRQAANIQIDRLMDAEPSHIVPVLEQLIANPADWPARLRRVAADRSAGAAVRLRAELGLVAVDRRHLDPLLDLMMNADPATVSVVRQWLRARAAPEPGRLWHLASGTERSHAEKLRIAALLAEFDPNSERWKSIAADVVLALVTDGSLDAEAWADLLAPSFRWLTPALVATFRDTGSSAPERLTATRVLAKLGTTALLCELLPDADVAPFAYLIQAIRRDPRGAIEPLRAVLTAPRAERDTADSAQAVTRQRNAAVALLLLGQTDLIWPLLEASTDGSLRSELISSVRAFGVPVEVFLRGEETVRDPVARQAIWLAIASYQTGLPQPRHNQILERVKDRWPRAQYQAERAGLAWLAQQWDSAAAVPVTPGTRGADWHVNPEGINFLEIHRPVPFAMGTPETAPRYHPNERQHVRKIARSFAISTLKITAGQFHRLIPEHLMDPSVCPTPDCPAVAITWFNAAKYCRRLSEREHVPEDQMCYPPVDQIRPGMEFPADMLSRTGYRLPTEAEWEYVARAGTTTRFFFGETDRRLSDYAWWMVNSGETTHPVGGLRPSAFGLFDVEGNVLDWCQDAFEPYQTPTDATPVGSVPAELQPVSDALRVLRGSYYRSPIRTCHSACRTPYAPEMNYSILGFRIARTLSVLDDPGP